MGLMKVFSGSEILATALKAKLEEAGIETLMKNNNQSNIILGSNGSIAVELFIDESKYGKADPVITDFKMSL
ncbi:hypothetical protein GGR22_000607 [Flavobacterium gossypii]|uniref:DUF2007 domain-containing protein n=3 Tax=Flavobacterium TaxID=237 RepID=A0ABR6DLB8_9FLAO|nr:MULTISPECIES: DUF2007 domain-containing protein [Flavobacterium]MBA9072481.1 hypothetical protein [Flavobacterium gossypii]RKS25515.1 putative signal transducing protein [Flavobacterium endophyticum]WDO12953.1 DUF2007 domain-containing protein [Flavobacterium sp. WW92]